MTQLTIPKGTDWAIQWPVDADLTGWDVIAQVRVSRASAETLHEWSTAVGNATAGDQFVRLSVGYAESADWAWSRGVYDVLLISPTGGREILEDGQGIVTVTTPVTREAA